MNRWSAVRRIRGLYVLCARLSGDPVRRGETLGDQESFQRSHVQVTRDRGMVLQGGEVTVVILRLQASLACQPDACWPHCMSSFGTTVLFKAPYRTFFRSVKK